MSDKTAAPTGAFQGQDPDHGLVVRGAAVVSEAIPDSLATQTASLQLLPYLDRAEDGPLLLGLLLNNQNNNNLAAAGIAPQNGSSAIPDSLAAQTAALELLPSPDQSGDGPLLLGSLLANQNSTNAAAGTIPDSLAAQQAPLELLPGPAQFGEPVRPGMLLANVNNDNDVDQAIPDSLATQTAALELSPNKVHAKSADGVLRLRGAFADPTSSVDAHQLQSWRENGFLVIPEVLPDAVLSQLLQSTRETVEKLIKGGDNVRVHSVSDGNKQQPYISPCGRVMASVEKGRCI